MHVPIGEPEKSRQDFRRIDTKLPYIDGKGVLMAIIRYGVFFLIVVRFRLFIEDVHLL